MLVVKSAVIQLPYDISLCVNINFLLFFSYGIEAYDASTKQNIVLTTEISLLITDFMMMSLACNHMGPAVNKFLS